MEILYWKYYYIIEKELSLIATVGTNLAKLMPAAIENKTQTVKYFLKTDNFIFLAILFHLHSDLFLSLSSCLPSLTGALPILSRPILF